MSEELDFDGPLAGVGDRNQLLQDAALALDRMSGHLGPGGKAEPTEEGELVRGFAEDIAEVQRPQLFRLAGEKLDVERVEIPVEVAELTRTSKFYWLSLPISLWSRPGWGFNRLEAKVELLPAGRATTFDVFPDESFKQLFEANAQVALGVNAGMKFAATVPVMAVGLPGVAGAEAGAGAGAEAEVQSNFVLGPFAYRMSAPRVKHSAPGLDHAFWRLDGAKYVQEQDPGLRLVVKVPNEASTLQVKATIQASRYFNMLSARLQERIRSLPEAVANFFRGGTPIRHSPDAFDLSDQM